MCYALAGAQSDHWMNALVVNCVTLDGTLLRWDVDVCVGVWNCCCSVMQLLWPFPHASSCIKLLSLVILSSISTTCKTFGLPIELQVLFCVWQCFKLFQLFLSACGSGLQVQAYTQKHITSSLLSPLNVCLHKEGSDIVLVGRVAWWIVYPWDWSVEECCGTWWLHWE